MANTSYNRIIRKLVVGFGNLFKDITLVRYNGDNSEAERFIVPIAYAAKEMYVQRLESDPNLDKKVSTTLPRMSFEMNGLQYDATRKQNTNIKNAAVTSGGIVKSQYNPVPYNFDFSLYLYVRNIEDGTQIIEHILPYFTPDYTIKLNLVPEMGIIKEIPVILNTTSSEVIYQGDRFSETRMVIWTLNFTVKGFVYSGYDKPYTKDLPAEALPIAFYEGSNTFIQDIKQKLLRFRKLSEKQIQAAISGMKREGIDVESLANPKQGRGTTELTKDIRDKFVEILNEKIRKSVD